MTDTVKWRAIAGDLSAQIARGEYRPGDTVPSEQELADRYHVTRMTARVALVHMEQTGLLSPGRHGTGRRVARHELLTIHIARTEDWVSPGESPSLGADAWLGDMRAAGRDDATQELAMITHLAGPELADRLEIAQESAVVARRLVRSEGGRPHNEITFWYPAAATIGTPLASPDSIVEGALSWLETNYGTLSHTVEITVRMPGLDEADRLHIPQGVPVAVVWRTSRVASGLPLVTSMAVYPADRTRLALVL